MRKIQVIRTIAAMVLFGGLAPASGAAKVMVPPPDILNIAVSTDKARYAEGEEIALTVSITNATHSSISIAHPDYWGVSEIHVTDEKGNRVEPDTYKAKRKPVRGIMTIAAGATGSHTFSKMAYYTCCYAGSFHGELGPGRYDVVVTITNPPVKVKPPKGWKRDWAGTLRSDPLRIEIR